MEDVSSIRILTSSVRSAKTTKMPTPIEETEFSSPPTNKRKLFPFTRSLRIAGSFLLARTVTEIYAVRYISLVSLSPYFLTIIVLFLHLYTFLTDYSYRSRDGTENWSHHGTSQSTEL